MFEHMSEENIREIMLSHLNPIVDKRQGSIAYDSIAASAERFAQLYTDLDVVLEIQFIDSAQGEFLRRKGENEIGVPPKDPVKAVRRATFTGSVPVLGKRFMADGIYWVVTDKNQITCEEVGTKGNSAVIGTNLIPTNFIEGLTEAKMGEVIIPGKDEEPAEEYRERIIKEINEPSFNCNKAQLEKWCTSIEGVGGVRIVPLWKGPTTVKGILIDTEKKPASSELVKKVQDAIDPVNEDGEQGLGEGLADFGVFFTAEAAKVLSIDINVTVEIVKGIDITNAKTDIEKVIDNYFKSLAFSEKEHYVKFAVLFAKIVELSNVADCKSLTLNGGTDNIKIPFDSIPQRKEVVINETH